jgi:hypothetical protein
MDHLYDNIHHILNIRDRVARKDENMYSHFIVNNNIIDENTITIVMTASNRSEQTYFTLKHISYSEYKNIQVIIVDDSDSDPILLDRLKDFPFYIDFLVINKEKKDWVNPCVNYNIGFNYIKGSKIIIQNAEVFHIGDIVSFVDKNVISNNYYVFDVKASLNYDTNKAIYETPNITTEIYKNESLFFMWYQHNKIRNLNYHFLTALTRDDFNRIKEFSYDYTMGNGWDDNDFLLKIEHQKLTIINIPNEEYFIGGIHLFHTPYYTSISSNSIPSNDNIFSKKTTAFNRISAYIDITENLENFGYKYFILINT